MKETYQVICPDCNQVIAELDMEYVENYPNSSDRYISELLMQHRSNTPDCPGHQEYEIRCPDCGEVLATYDEEYANKYPNSLDRWEAQLLEEHSIKCPKGGYNPEIIDEFEIKGKKFKVEVNYLYSNEIREYYRLIPSKGSILPEPKANCWFEYVEEVISVINQYILENEIIRNYEVELDFISICLYELKYKFLEWYYQQEKENPYIKEGYYGEYKKAIEKGLEIGFKSKFLVIRGVLGGEFLEEIIFPTLDLENEKNKPRNRRSRIKEEIEEIKEEA